MSVFTKGVYMFDQTEVKIADEIKAAEGLQRLYLSGAHEFTVPSTMESRPGVIEFTEETTVGAARRLIVEDGITATVALNFANPVWPGGGYVRGAIAQEEDICRCSVLYNFLIMEGVDSMYDVSEDNALFTDNMILTQNVPVIRDDMYKFLPNPILQNFITCAAPMAFRYKGPVEDVNAAMEQRIRRIIMCAIENKYEAIVLGAFGCGAFRCDAVATAAAFRKVLVDEKLREYFAKITFAIWADKDTLRVTFIDAFKGVLQ